MDPLTPLWLLTHCESRTSRSGQPLWHIRWSGTDPSCTAETWLDPCHHNWHRHRWWLITDSDQPWGVYTGLRLTPVRSRSGQQVISGDSAWQRVIVIPDRETLAQVIEQLALT